MTKSSYSLLAKNCIKSLGWEALVVDAWAGHVYTKKEFSVANTTFPHYGINNNITGKAQHIIKYAGSGVSINMSCPCVYH
jgi:hypothetical protein